MKKIVGYSKFVSKKGTDTCIVHVVEPFSDGQLSRGCVGSEADTIAIYDKEIFDKVTESCIGKTLDVSYNVSNGRAFVRDISIR